MSSSVEETVAALLTRVDELSDFCARLSRENEELQRRVTATVVRGPSSARDDEGGSPMDETNGRMDRRTLGKLLGVTAAALVGGSAISELAASPAAASNGAAVTAGSQTTAEARTSVLYDGASNFGGVVLLGNDSTYGGQSANYPAGLGGWAGAGATAGKGGVANGVYGFTDNGNGNGVVGYNSGAIAGSGAGVLGLAFGPKATAVEAVNTEGTAISGTSESTSADAMAIIGTISSTAPGGFSAAVRGVNNGTSGLGIGVWGSQAGSGWGMYATSFGGIGLNASGGSGVGVSASGATALSASGDDVGVSASAGSGSESKPRARQHCRLRASPSACPPPARPR